MSKYLSILAAALTFFSGNFCEAQATKLPTLDEALEISRGTGKPIFALAGRST